MAHAFSGCTESKLNQHILEYDLYKGLVDSANIVIIPLEFDIEEGSGGAGRVVSLLGSLADE